MKKLKEVLLGLLAVGVVLLLVGGGCYLRIEACHQKFPNVAEWVCILDAGRK